MFSKILIPLDGSNLSEKAISHAQSLAEKYGATIHLLQVVSRHPSDGGPQGDGQGAGDSVFRSAMSNLAGDSHSDEEVRRLKEAQVQDAQTYLDQIASPLRANGIQVETKIDDGVAQECITEYALRNNLDVIVMSTHGRGGMKRMIVGSVTDNVIRSGKVPVLVVTSDSA